jgi:predicted Zn-ribbon and HTH transcriptional regulator
MPRYCPFCGYKYKRDYWTTIRMKCPECKSTFRVETT